MDHSRRILSFCLVALVGVVTGVLAFVGVQQAPAQPVTSLQEAAKNTLAATSYVEDLTEVSQSNGTVTLHAVAQLPDQYFRYLQQGSQREYTIVVGNTVYEGQLVTPTTNFKAVRFSAQLDPGVIPQLDPLPAYLEIVSRATSVHQSGDTFTFTTLLQPGLVARATYTVTGEYITKMVVDYSGAHDVLTMSSINNAPPIQVPAQSAIVQGGLGSAGGSS